MMTKRKRYGQSYTLDVATITRIDEIMEETHISNVSRTIDWIVQEFDHLINRDKQWEKTNKKLGHALGEAEAEIKHLKSRLKLFRRQKKTDSRRKL